MKKRMIYKESASVSDMSKDRVHLNLSYQEYMKLWMLIQIGTDYIENKVWQKKAENIKRMLAHCEELEPIWDKSK